MLMNSYHDIKYKAEDLFVFFLFVLNFNANKLYKAVTHLPSAAFQIIFVIYSFIGFKNSPTSVKILFATLYFKIFGLSVCKGSIWCYDNEFWISRPK